MVFCAFFSPPPTLHAGIPGLVPMVRDGVQLFSCINRVPSGYMPRHWATWGDAKMNVTLLQQISGCFTLVGEEMQKAKCGPEAVLKAGFFLV